MTHEEEKKTGTALHRALEQVGAGDIELEDAIRTTHAWRCTSCGNTGISIHHKCPTCEGELEPISFQERQEEA